MHWLYKQWQKILDRKNEMFLCLLLQETIFLFWRLQSMQTARTQISTKKLEKVPWLIKIYPNTHIFCTDFVKVSEEEMSELKNAVWLLRNSRMSKMLIWYSELCSILNLPSFSYVGMNNFINAAEFERI